MCNIGQYLLFVILSLCCCCESLNIGRNFSIDYKHNTFIKDGKAFRYISGSIHYSRVPFPYWQDRLRKMYAAGLDAIQVYVPWNVHQPQYDEFDFEGQNDLVRFIKLADDIGLLVILRGGPYICGEWEYGGFPYWLKQANQSIVLRSMDPGYLRPVTKWFSVLLPKIKPFLYENGGPIIMVQIENEYGSYPSCDHQYMAYLRDMFKYYLGNKVVLFTTDGSGKKFLQCGAIDGVYATVDFGPGSAQHGFAPMKMWSPEGPLVNSEYYTGWLDYWGGKWNYISTTPLIKTLRDMLDMGANVNMYMFEGGTNFGYMNGADPVYRPVVTSYDYDAPLSEAGDITDKYMAIRELISQYKVVPPDVPPNTTKESYGEVRMKKIAIVSDVLPVISPQGCIKTMYPVTMEQARQPYGYALYRTVLTRDVEDAKLDLTVVRDRAYVTLDKVSVGVVYRNSPSMTVSFSGKKGQELDILVENMGRVNYGNGINENQKGLVGNVTLDNIILTSWQYCNIDLTEAFNLTEVSPYPSSWLNHMSKMSAPTLYHGSFTLAGGHVPADTYLNMCGWNKGQALINGFNLGRYWPTEGPQVTLYVPGLLIKPYPETNVIVLFELMAAPSGCDGDMWECEGNQAGCSVRLEKTSILGAKCDQNGQVMMARSESKEILTSKWKRVNM